MKRGEASKHRGVRVVWDEQNLGFWEAHKTPKQKIDEPKTPYHPPEAEEDIVTPTPEQNAAHADAVRLALTQVASTSDRRVEHADGEGSGASSSSVDDIQHRYNPEPKSMEIDEPPSQLRRCRSFEEKRHIHQLEYRRAKSALGHRPMFEDDENDQKDKGQASGSGASSSNSCPDDPESNISKGFGDIDIQDA
ncbi:hypothetical protein R1flu_011098 [Riccia fluitans]|uniref:Protein phosphatase inhibitor 2 n=1 Tax=Riccia fluitans TaxID=41844 RepID=A0ABD1Z6U8_9MARC